MIKLFLNQFIVNKFFKIILWLILHVFLVFLFTKTPDSSFKFIIISNFKGSMTFLFIIPALSITLMDNKYFKISLETVLKNIHSNLIKKYYVFSTFLLSLVFSLPITIYELYLYQQVYISPESYYSIMFLKLTAFISLILFFTILFTYFIITEPDKNHYFIFVLINILIIFPITFYLNWTIPRMLSNYLPFKYSSFYTIPSDIFQIIIFLFFSFYFFNNIKFKHYIDFSENL